MNAPNLGTENPMTDQEILVERVANAIEAPFLPHGYELKPHLLRAAARAAIASMPHSEQVEGWQPIETAPKDGTDFLAWGECYGVRPTYHTHWQDNLTNESRFGFRGSFCLERAEDATHWMPLPMPPALTRNVSDKE